MRLKLVVDGNAGHLAEALAPRRIPSRGDRRPRVEGRVRLLRRGGVVPPGTVSEDTHEK